MVRIRYSALALSVLGTAVVAAILPVSAGGQVDSAGAPRPEVPLRLAVPQGQREWTREGRAPRLTLNDAIAEALAQNLDLAAQRAAVDVARQRPAQARALDAPMLGVQLWQWPVRSADPRQVGGYMLMAEQRFPARGARALREQVAEADITVQELEVAVDREMVVEAVSMAYADLAFARTSVEVYGESLALLRQLADSAQVRYGAGRVAQADVLQPLVEISRIHERLIEAEDRMAVAEARLNRWRGRPIHEPIGALDPLEPRRLTASLGEILDLALDHQPALRASDARIAAARADVNAAGADLRPDYAVQGGYMVMPREGDTWTAQIAISWPRVPWSRRGIDARVAEAEHAVTAARARHAAVETQVQLAVQEAYVRARTAERRSALLRTSVVPQIEQTFSVVQAAYRADRADLLNVIDVQRMLLDTRLEVVDASAAFAVAVAELTRAVGTDLTPFILPAGELLAAHAGGE